MVPAALSYAAAEMPVNMAWLVLFTLLATIGELVLVSGGPFLGYQIGSRSNGLHDDGNLVPIIVHRELFGRISGRVLGNYHER